MDFTVEGLTLGNVAGGKLEERFQEELAKVVEVFADPLPFAQSSDGKVKAKITVALEFAIDAKAAAEMGTEAALKTVNATVGYSGPKRKSLAHAIHVQSGAVVFHPNMRQEPLFSSEKSEGAANVTPIAGARKE